MSYSEDIVISKLSGINETQEAVVNISQWLMFHRRHAKRSVKTWAQVLADVPAYRKLALIYLANEVLQQAKMRGREEFLLAFPSIIVDALDNAYRQCTTEVQVKIKRVVEVWRTRDILPPTVLADIDSRLDDADKKKPRQANTATGSSNSTGAGTRRLGFGLGLPPELSKLATANTAITTRATAYTAALKSATSSYDATFDADALPAPPEYAAQIGKLLEELTTATTAANELASARREYINQLEALVKVHTAALEASQTEMAELEKKHDYAQRMLTDVQEMLGGKKSDGDEDNTAIDFDPGSASGASAMETFVSDPVYMPMEDTPESTPSPPQPPPPRLSGAVSDTAAEAPTAPTSSSGFEGLDPAVAQFLSSIGREHAASAT
ncbi:RNA polymerase II-binding domain-containing protein [Limtongia smithiae]|uniref:RNA polymerase II-binding domain-containing protein n=1 Tax=Limtongia smithiae TaxID=1125753 RepID=UPI0034CD4339